MLNVLIFYIFFPFLLGLILFKLFIPFLKKKNIIAIDQQKINKPILATSGGIPFFIGVLISALFIFFFKDYGFDISFFFLALIPIFFIFLIGLLDDITFDKKKKKSIYGDIQFRVGLPQWLKPLLSIFAFVPIYFLVNSTTINLPFTGNIDLGIFYFILIFILFIVFSNSTNMLAGMNGLEGSLMFIISFCLAIATFLTNEFELFIICIIFLSSSLAYLVFNWYPAKILPGDSLTYIFGGFFATIIVIGQLKLFAFFIFIPWIIEIILKLRGKLKVRSLGDIQKDGSLKPPYKEIYSWTHIFMFLPRFLKMKAKEPQITICISLVVLVFCILGLIIFF